MSTDNAVSLAPVVGDINAMVPRAAMGLPSGWTRFECDDLASDVVELRAAPVSDLVLVVESVAAPARRRFAAGLLLALLGDPRVDPVAPSMIDVPGAPARIGTPAAEAVRIADRYHRQGVRLSWIRKECPDHTVNLADYRIGRFPVTNLEYRAYLRDSPDGEIPTSWHLGRFPVERANHPVFSVRPESADAYCRWLSQVTGRRFRLPTEAEWEYAAAGPDRTDFPWGDEYRAGRCNSLEEQIVTTTPVGMFPAGDSWIGAADVAGNVEEFVSDTYRPYPGGQVIEDDLYKMVGPDYRVARGGSFNRFQDMTRSRRRHGGPLNLTFYAMGFRLAEEMTA